MTSATPVTHVLTTDRLELRPVAPSDHARLLAHWTLPEVRQFMFDGAVMSAAEVTDVIDESTATFRDAGFGIWLISARHGGELTGTAGLRSLDDLGLEIIYSLAPTAWGKGYATEAASAVLDYALGPLALPEVLAEIDEGNAASAAVARRLGMTAFDTVPGLLGPMTRYRRTATTC